MADGNMVSLTMSQSTFQKHLKQCFEDIGATMPGDADRVDDDEYVGLIVDALWSLVVEKGFVSNQSLFSRPRSFNISWNVELV